MNGIHSLMNHREYSDFIFKYNERPQPNYLRIKRDNAFMENIKGITQNKDFKVTAEMVLFFDMDGTLIDTNLANFHSYKKAIISVTKSNHNLIYNPDVRFNRGYLKNAVPNLSTNQYDRIIQKKENYYKDFLHETILNPVFEEILLKYSKTNKTVLVTNCRKERALLTLKHFGLVEKFSYIFYRKFSGNDKKVNKFQNAISKLGIPPNIVVVFENEEIEIVDAKQAGIVIINPIITIENV